MLLYIVYYVWSNTYLITYGSNLIYTWCTKLYRYVTKSFLANKISTKYATDQDKSRRNINRISRFLKYLNKHKTFCCCLCAFRKMHNQIVYIFFFGRSDLRGKYAVKTNSISSISRSRLISISYWLYLSLSKIYNHFFFLSLPFPFSFSWIYASPSCHRRS